MIASPLRNIDALILAGGLGTRVRSVLGETPKVLAPIDGRPYLAWLLEFLSGQGVQRVVLALGHLAGAVTAWLGANHIAGIDIVTVTEPEPMGTAGAIRHCRSAIRSDTVLVMNGDSFIAADLGQFLAGHHMSGAAASLLCARVDDASRFGLIEIGPSGRIAAFREKDTTQQGGGIISAGVYLLDRTFLDRMMALPGPSIERDIFGTVEPHSLHAHVTEGDFIDIGTPQTLAAAGETFRRIKAAQAK